MSRAYGQSQRAKRLALLQHTYRLWFERLRWKAHQSAYGKEQEEHWMPFDAWPRHLDSMPADKRRAFLKKLKEDTETRQREIDAMAEERWRKLDESGGEMRKSGGTIVL